MYTYSFTERTAKFKDREGYVVGGINPKTYLSIHRENLKSSGI